MTVTDLDSDICRVSSISCLLLPPATQTKPPRRLRLLPPPMAGSASAALSYVPSNVAQSLPLFPHTSCYSSATSAPTRTRTRTSQPTYSPPPATGPAHLPRLLFVPSEASPSSSALVCSPCAVRRPLVLSTPSTTERNKYMTVRGEDDSRDPPVSWQYASKCLMVGHLGLTPSST